MMSRRVDGQQVPYTLVRLTWEGALETFGLDENHSTGSEEDTDTESLEEQLEEIRRTFPLPKK